VLCELKPYDLVTYFDRQLKIHPALDPWHFAEYDKATTHARTHAVCLIGDAPISLLNGMPIGAILDNHPLNAAFTFDDLHDVLCPSIATEPMWREAGNRVQWISENDNRPKRAYRRKNAA